MSLNSKEILTGLISFGEKTSSISPLIAYSPLFLTNSTLSYILAFKKLMIVSNTFLSLFDTINLLFKTS